MLNDHVDGYPTEDALECSIHEGHRAVIAAAERQLNEHAICGPRCEYRRNAFEAMEKANAFRANLGLVAHERRHYLAGNPNYCASTVFDALRAARELLEAEG